MLGRFARCLALLAVVAVVVPTTALADTEPGTNPVNSYQLGADFSFVDGGTTWSGNVTVEVERISGARYVSFYFAGSGATRQCDGGTPDDPTDDVTVSDYVEFFSTRAVVKEFVIADSLSAAKFDASLVGTRVTLHACTGETVRSRTERHAVVVKLVASGAPESGQDIFIVNNEDGTQTEVTQRYSSVSASGKVEIDGNRVEMSNGVLSHTELIPRQLESRG
jgi:hypothetical protein